MKVISKYYLFFSWISLDVAFGAVMLQLCLAHIFDVLVSFSASSCLFVAVFLIYNLDHLMDARNGQKIGDRRMFYLRHSKPISMICGLLVPVFVTLALQLPPIILQVGLVLGLLILIYLLLVYLFPKTMLKELVVAFGYVAGVSFAPLVLTQSLSTYYILVGQLILIAFVNLVVFAYFERDQDRENRSQSLPLILGQVVTVRLIWALIALSLVVVGIGIYFQLFIRFQLILASMTLGMAAIMRFDSFFSERDRFRMIGDGIFLLPGLYLL